jgi:hypothetical protein
MYAAIRQVKAKAGMAEELARRIKEGAIPIISDVPGFQAYYVIYAGDDTVTAISIFDGYAGTEESNRRGLAWIEQSLAPLLTGPAIAPAACRRTGPPLAGKPPCGSRPGRHGRSFRKTAPGRIRPISRQSHCGRKPPPPQAVRWSEKFRQHPHRKGCRLSLPNSEQLSFPV